MAIPGAANARVPHALCAATPPGFLIREGSDRNLPEWDNPIIQEEALAITGPVSEADAVALGFASWAEMAYCVGMEPRSRAWWVVVQTARRFTAGGPLEKTILGGMKVLLFRQSAFLRGLWAGGQISSVGLEALEAEKRGSLDEELASLQQRSLGAERRT